MTKESDDMNRLQDLQIRESLSPQNLKVFVSVFPRQLCELECKVAQCFVTWIKGVKVRLSRSDRAGESLTTFSGSKVSQMGFDSVVTIIGLAGDDGEPFTFSGSQFPWAFHQLDVELHERIEKI